MDEFEAIAARLLADDELAAAFHAAVDEITAVVMRDPRFRARTNRVLRPGRAVAFVGGKTYHSDDRGNLPAAARRKMADYAASMRGGGRQALLANSRWHQTVMVAAAANRAFSDLDDDARGLDYLERARRARRIEEAAAALTPGGLRAWVTHEQAMRARARTGVAPAPHAGALARFLSMWFDPQ
ncbi:hypothetical protein F8568_036780 [Actinomadura sp. LD22]|uniref:Uncharacterized protein n=1 Tax=Actinomadura physcomitrii TaxID=2650748 RepID=A0A6I4MI15_9ACTN|nr:hypothetical protein [Actinomadura physcomitrii]MWA05818.1 hypothetical protein [Actinomadura physcomitrii]